MTTSQTPKHEDHLMFPMPDEAATLWREAEQKAQEARKLVTERDQLRRKSERLWHDDSLRVLREAGYEVHEVNPNMGQSVVVLWKYTPGSIDPFIKQNYHWNMNQVRSGLDMREAAPTREALVKALEIKLAAKRAVTNREIEKLEQELQAAKAAL